MNAFVKKEIRLLLPNFAIACVLALSNLMLREAPDGWFAGLTYFITVVICPAAVIMLTLSSFGTEVGSGTLAGLLAQPISRQKIWDTKISLLSAALLGVGVLWCSTILTNFYVHGKINGAHAAETITLEMVTTVGSFAMVVFTGGLWTVLLLRQVASAFWFTLLVPGALLVLIAAFFAGSDDNVIMGIIATVMGLYSLAGFFFARWLFFRAQDLQWSGGNIEMPELRGLAWFRVGTKAARGWHPRAALWRKEIMLHQSQLLIAFVLAVLHLGVLGTRHFMDMTRHRDLQFILSIFWGLWLVMPFLVGCAAVAEERKLGTLEGQHCLPAGRRTQFFIKLAVVVGLSLLLGVIMPVLFEGTNIIHGAHLHVGTPTSSWWNGMPGLDHLIWYVWAIGSALGPLLPLMFIAVAAGIIAFHASSLARNTLQTLGPAVLTIMTLWGLMVAAVAQWQQGYEFLWRGPLPFVIGIPLFAFTLIRLAFSNFKHVRTDMRLVGHNAAVLVATTLATVILSAGIYHRCWEKLTSFEPNHGAAQLARDGNSKLVYDHGEFLVTLPDGKILVAGLGPVYGTDNPISMMLGNLRVQLSNWKVLGGTNWLVLHHSFRDIAGIKPDGTLWVASQPRNHASHLNDTSSDLAQYGSETNWSSLAGFNNSMLLVKTDGTLWLWAADDRSYEDGKKQWPGLSHFTPRRIGMDTDWAEVKQASYQVLLQRKDGGLFSTANQGSVAQQPMEIDSHLTLYPVPDMFQVQTPNTVSLWSFFGTRLRVGSDGAFRIVARQELTRHGNYSDWHWIPRDLPIGHDNNWLAAAGEGSKAVTLKRDGTLWMWDFSPRNIPGMYDFDASEGQIQRTVPVQLGSHSDWIAIASFDSGSVVALAADGSLWYWPLTPNRYFADQPESFPPLLDVSHKPQLIGNVFAVED